jgi:hypothetical protein
MTNVLFQKRSQFEKLASIVAKGLQMNGFYRPCMATGSQAPWKTTAQPSPAWR